MKNILLSLLSCAYIFNLSAQNPDFQISNLDFTLSKDTLKPKFSIQSDTFDIDYSLVVFISNDNVLDSGDQLKLFTTEVAQKNATVNFNGVISFPNELIDSVDKYVIVVVTHQFEGTPSNFDVNKLKADAYFLDNIASVAFSFPSSVVVEHNQPLTNNNIDTTGLTVNEAAALLTMPSYESTLFASAGTILEDVNNGTWDLVYVKNFKISNQMPVNLNGSVIQVILSEDAVIDPSDLIIDQLEVDLLKKEEYILRVDAALDFEAKTQGEVVGEMSGFTYWPTSNPSYGDAAKSYVFVRVQFGLGDTITVTKTFSFGGISEWNYKTKVFSGTEGELVNNQFLIKTLLNKNYIIQSGTQGKLSLIDLSGKKLKEVDLLSGANIIDLNFLENGVYIFYFETENGAESHRVLVD